MSSFRTLIMAVMFAVSMGLPELTADQNDRNPPATIAVQVKKIASSKMTNEQKLAALHVLQSRQPHAFSWELHNELRHMYAGSDERASMGHCDIILKHSPNDSYILSILSDWKLGKDSQAAAEALESKADRYADLPHLAAACLAKARSLRREG